MKKQFLLALVLIFAARVTGFAQEAAPAEMPSTESVMTKAYDQAKKEHKNVIVIFHASWCGWCKKMEASMNEPELKKFFDENYVIARLDVMENKGKENLENPGALAFMTKYKGEKSGLPFWLVTDAKGNKLADSQMRPAGASLDTYGDNVGCPAEEKEVAFFAAILKATSKMKDNEIAMISERFAKNKPAPVVKPAAKPVSTSE